MEDKSKYQTIFNSKKIQEILPHRYPFLLVDKVVHLDLNNNEIIGVKNLTFNESFFQGHFPQAPIMPGVLILEALAQTGGILVHQKGFGHKIALFLNIANAKFRNPATPGDILFLHAKGLLINNKGGKFTCVAKIQDKIAAEAEMSFALVDKETI
jgi:3-hydroxyacyl-[acyl-carrier-protein] dehydratase